ncbi:18S rRNA pseudouridine methyltransferase [Ascosphaera pollenicola]|nr:18S rRNA pseudouridine methyltransferase [Ascosphaera pollenicola]
MLCRRLIWVLFSFTAISIASPIIQAPLIDVVPEDGKLGAVSCEHELCSRIGADILSRGGNAADIIEALHHSGIGGGGFMVVRNSDGTKEFIDFREIAPAAASRDMFSENRNGSIFGGSASGVPGEVRGLQYLHEKYGKLPWKDLVLPAVEVARNGWELGHDLARYMSEAITSSGFDFFTEDPSWAIDFAPNGTRLGAGDAITRSRYARTLELIAQKGPDVFYEGPMAEDMVQTVQRTNGTLTMQDMRDYKIKSRESYTIDYRGYKVSSGPLPSGGPVLLSILNVLNLYDDFFSTDLTNLSTHRMDEAIRFGYAMRTKLGDPEYVEGMTEYQEYMLSQKTAERHRGDISDIHTQNITFYDSVEYYNDGDHGTTHVVTADSTGMAVSMTSTVNLLFGSTVMTPETGIVMNNVMDDFSLPGTDNKFGFPPSPANYIAPGKRPLSSTSASIVERPDGSLFFVTGAAGGSRIITSTLSTIINVIDRNMSVSDALAEPRLHDQLMPNLLVLEETFNRTTAEFLRSREHDIVYIPIAQSAVQALRLHEDGTFEAAGEVRQEDSAGLVV